MVPDILIVPSLSPTDPTSSCHHLLVLNRMLFDMAARPKLCSADTQAMYLQERGDTQSIPRLPSPYRVSGVRSVIVNLVVPEHLNLFQYLN